MKKLLTILCFITTIAKAQVIDTVYQTGNNIDSVTRGKVIALKTLYGIVYITVFQVDYDCITVAQTSAFGNCIPDVVIEWHYQGTTYSHTIYAMQPNTDYVICMNPIDFEDVVWVYAVGFPCFSNYVAIRMLTSLPLNLRPRDDPLHDSLINVFPNPNNGRFTIAFNQTERQDYDIDIVNNVGRERIINLRQATKQNVIVEGLSRGYYFIRVENKTKHHSQTFKVIVQ